MKYDNNGPKTLNTYSHSVLPKSNDFATKLVFTQFVKGSILNSYEIKHCHLQTRRKNMSLSILKNETHFFAADILYQYVP